MDNSRGDDNQEVENKVHNFKITKSKLQITNKLQYLNSKHFGFWSLVLVWDMPAGRQVWKFEFGIYSQYIDKYHIITYNHIMLYFTLLL